METKATTLENLFEKVEQFGKTSLELYKHKAIYEIAVLTSTLSVRLILVLVIALVSFFLSIGAALWLGDILEKNYYGYFIVALAYVVLGLILFIFRKPWIKTQVSNLVIKSMLKPL
ncbi:hypothetical protein ACSVH2_10590 [Flavobacterium sp. RSB2_4_14]|uniref:hypothetical protein n=1 Tax=Flavobacterium sp. RSB2_4_14 TaxID=3447665 RepID=UPI003F40AE1F